MIHQNHRIRTAVAVALATAAVAPAGASAMLPPDPQPQPPPPAPHPNRVVVRVSSNGFDWGDAGIGAAGILALLSIAGGLTLMATTRRRRHGTEMPAH